jgi:hypothetical protein
MARQPQKNGPVIKSARTRNPAATNPSYTDNQPGSMIYSPVASPPSVLKDQGNNIVPLIPTAVSRVSKQPLALIGNGTVVGVFELGANTKEARVRFTTSRITATGKAAYGNAVAFSAPGDLVGITDTEGNAVAVGLDPVQGAPVTGHLVTDDVTGQYNAIFLYDTVGEKSLILTFGNETFLLTLNVV